MNSNNSSLLSDTITYLRFPLIVCVVMLHTFILGESQFGIVHIPVGKFPVFDVFEHVIKADIGEMAVPLFFFISGFLFFYKTDFNLSIYRLKLKRRFHSLFIPYLFWNIAYILFIMIVQIIHPEWTDNRKSVLNFSFSDIIDAFWTLNQGLIPLWFIRDLIVINIFAPLIHFLIKHLGLVPIFVIGIMYFLGIGFYLPGIGTRSSFYYILGAFFSINKINFLDIYHKYYKAHIIGVSMLIIIETYIWSHFSMLAILNRLVILSGVIVIPMIIAHGIQMRKLKPNKFLAESSFFVFAFHMFIIYIPSKFWVIFLPVNTITTIAMQVVIPVVISYICVAIYYLLKKTAPKFSLFIVGGR